MSWLTLTDGELASHYVQEQDDQAFAELVRRHAGMVRRTCRRITGSEHDADDLTQLVFTLLAERAESLVSHQSIAGWLYNTAWHLSSRMLRAARRRRRHEATVAGSRPHAQSNRENGDDLGAELSLALSKLPSPYHDVLVLYHFAGLTLSHIAQMNGEPVGTVAARLSRARAMLRRELSSRGLGLAVVSLPYGNGLDVGQEIADSSNVRARRATPDAMMPPEPSPALASSPARRSLYGSVPACRVFDSLRAAGTPTESGAAWSVMSALTGTRAAVAASLIAGTTLGAATAQSAEFRDFMDLASLGYTIMLNESDMEPEEAERADAVSGPPFQLDYRSTTWIGTAPEPSSAAIAGGAFAVMGALRPRRRLSN